MLIGKIVYSNFPRGIAILTVPIGGRDQRDPKSSTTLSLDDVPFIIIDEHGLIEFNTGTGMLIVSDVNMEKSHSCAQRSGVDMQVVEKTLIPTGD